MSGIVLVVGVLMTAAGAYEMVAGNGDILSERGWSAFIAGSVLVAGGVVTMALGMAVRAVDRLHDAILRDQLAISAVAAPAERLEPASRTLAPMPIAAAPPPQRDLFHEPIFEQAPTAPVLAAVPIELALVHEPYSAAPAHSEPPPRPESAGAEPQHDDWLDHSFAELERDMAVRHEPAEVSAPALHQLVAASAEPVPIATSEPSIAALEEPHPTSVVHDEAPAGIVAHDPIAPETHAVEPDAVAQAPPDLATVSAREEPAPAIAAVIGRYESEGTSYVMYADGSIDAQSDAGVYRFASMAELKTFIES